MSKTRAANLFPSFGFRIPGLGILPGPLAACLLGLVLVFPAGCGKTEQAAGASNPKAFDSAPAEAKSLWVSALAAAQTNDYASAILTLRQLRLQPDLSPALLSAIDTESGNVKARMDAAAQKGDTNALEAIQQLIRISRAPRR